VKGKNFHLPRRKTKLDFSGEKIRVICKRERRERWGYGDNRGKELDFSLKDVVKQDSQKRKFKQKCAKATTGGGGRGEENTDGKGLCRRGLLE